MNDNSHEVSAIDRAITGRRTTRQFLSTQVPRALIEEILRVARHAPSGNNIQPWRAHVVDGKKRDELCARVCAEVDKGPEAVEREYDYYPSEFFEPYQGRRRQTGWGLYGVLGIAKGDREAMQRQHRRNFELFDAPLALVCTIDRRLAQGSWLDCGMFVQNVLLAAHARGVDSCVQTAWIDYYRVVGEVLDFAPEEKLLCVVALGFRDPEAPVNGFATERCPLDEFARFHGGNE
ncbi:MAG: nitroreductase [Betaproteobacteria bacterium]|nr:nitroreductase [Betaproteobacteria bacterium]